MPQRRRSLCRRAASPGAKGRSLEFEMRFSGGDGQDEGQRWRRHATQLEPELRHTPIHPTGSYDGIASLTNSPSALVPSKPLGLSTTTDKHLHSVMFLSYERVLQSREDEVLCFCTRFKRMNTHTLAHVSAEHASNMEAFQMKQQKLVSSFYFYFDSKAIALAPGRFVRMPCKCGMI